MANVDDPQNFAQRLRGRLENVDDSEEVGELTTEAIDGFAEAHQEGAVEDDEEISISTLADYVRQLRLAAEALDLPLPRADVADLEEAWLDDRRKKYAANTYNSSASALIKFSRYYGLEWHIGEDEERITTVPTSRGEVDEDRLFTDAEVNKLLEEGDARDRLMIALLADLGCRVGALCTFRIRDLYLKTKVPQIRFNPDAPVKTASGKVLLTWSKGHLQTYLSVDHPRPDDPSAPVLHKEPGWVSDDDDGALSPDRVRDRLKTLGEAVGIARERMKPHNFRHTAVSNWIRQGYRPQDIVHRASWADSQMLDVYNNVTDEMMNEDIAARMGIVEDEEVARDPSDATIPCPQCNDPVRRNADYCGNCGLKMSRAPAYESGSVDELPGADEPMPGEVDPDEVWGDGAGADLLDEMEPETVLIQLLQRDDLDIDVDDLLDD